MEISFSHFIDGLQIECSQQADVEQDDCEFAVKDESIEQSLADAACNNFKKRLRGRRKSKDFYSTNITEIDLESLQAFNDVVDENDSALYLQLLLESKITVDGYKIMTADAEVALFEEYKKSNDKKAASNAIVCRFFPLVTNVALQISRRYPRNIDFNDLIGSGVVGLYEAIPHYNPQKGRFAELASQYIKFKVQNLLIDESNTIRIPDNKQKLANRIDKARQELACQLNVCETDVPIKEIANSLGEDVFSVIELTQLKSLKSLDVPLNANDDSSLSLGDTIVSESRSTEENIVDKEKKRALSAAMRDVLNKDELTVLMLNYGYIDDTEYTLKAIAKSLNKSPERIRQIRNKAVVKLREALATNGWIAS